MRNPFLTLMSAAGIGLLAVGCGSKSSSATAAENTPEAFLKWSMDQYHLAKTFSTGIDFKMSSVGFSVKLERRRTFDYQSPNLYRCVTALLPDKAHLTCVSDGTNEIDYSDNPKAKAVKTAAPAELNSIASDTMNRPDYAGSLIYKFFGGGDDIGELEQQGGEQATWGSEGTSPTGEPTKTVRFMSASSYGHVEASIGTKTGLVYQFKFDSQPLVDQRLKGHTAQEAIDELKKQLPKVPKGSQHDTVQKAIASGPSIFTVTGLETFANPKFDAAEEVALFRPEVPKGMAYAPPKPDGLAPVPIGTKAPDITVQDTSGNAVKLSSLRGHVVVLDFWATWCGPCKVSLPVTAALASKYAGKGLRVLAISTEQTSLVSQFVKAQTYKLPAFLDHDQSATYAYHVDKLPTTVIIDANGNLAEYYGGVAQADELQASLVRAGLKVSS